MLGRRGISDRTEATALIKCREGKEGALYLIGRVRDFKKGVVRAV